LIPSFERSEAQGDITLHFFTDRVVCVQWPDAEPPDLPLGENWLVPRGGGTSRFAYCPPTRFIVFYHTLAGEYPYYHGGAMAELREGFKLNWPTYDRWVRAIASQKAIKVSIKGLGAGMEGKINKRKAYRNLRNALRRLVSLGGIPDDYLVRVFHEDDSRTVTRVKDWV
jgi:hypothetical protein